MISLAAYTTVLRAGCSQLFDRNESLRVYTIEKVPNRIVFNPANLHSESIASPCAVQYRGLNSPVCPETAMIRLLDD